jgi:hypothetical protein
LRKTISTTLIAAIIITSGVVFYIFVPDELRSIIISSCIIFLILWFLFQYLERNNEFEKNMILAVGFGLTIISWFVTGYLNNQNEIKRNRLNIEQGVLQKKRDLRTKFLLNAYLRLDNFDNRYSETDADNYIYRKYAESALTSIQLLGDSELVKLTHNWIMNSNDSISFNKLLRQLRNDLRQELAISKLPDNDTSYNTVTFRIYRNWLLKDTLTSEQEIQLIIKLNEINQDLVK